MIAKGLIKLINLDISNKCALACPGCNRQKYYDGDGRKIPGRDITLREMKMIVDWFDHISFCGQVSDPLYHPQFYEILKIVVDSKKSAVIYHASVLKSKQEYLKYFLLTKNKNVKWVFALDGLPSQSHLYRKNQNGERMFEVMKMCALMGIKTEWDYIVFNYNENNIQECKNLAEKYGIKFNTIISSRWWENCETMQPKDPALSFPPRSYVQDMLKIDPEHPWYS